MVDDEMSFRNSKYVNYAVETNGNKIRSWSEMRYKGLK